MEKFIAVIKHEEGLHARPASQLVKIAKDYAAEVKLEKEGKAVDAKRLLGVLSLNVRKGDTIKITTEGSDEKEAIAALRHVVGEY